MTGPWGNIKFFGALGAFVDFKKHSILKIPPTTYIKITLIEVGAHYHCWREENAGASGAIQTSRSVFCTPA